MLVSFLLNRKTRTATGSICKYISLLCALHFGRRTCNARCIKQQEAGSCFLWAFWLHCTIQASLFSATERLKTTTYCVQIRATRDSQSALPFCHPDALRRTLKRETKKAPLEHQETRPGNSTWSCFWPPWATFTIQPSKLHTNDLI